VINQGFSLLSPNRAIKTSRHFELVLTWWSTCMDPGSSALLIIHHFYTLPEAHRRSCLQQGSCMRRHTTKPRLPVPCAARQWSRCSWQLLLCWMRSYELQLKGPWWVHLCLNPTRHCNHCSLRTRLLTVMVQCSSLCTRVVQGGCISTCALPSWCWANPAHLSFDLQDLSFPGRVNARNSQTPAKT